MFNLLRSHLSNYLQLFVVKIRSFQINLFGFVTLRPQKRKQGNVLIAYLQEPFVLEPGRAFPNTHSSYWECWQVVQTFLEFGYCVDVIHFFNRDFVPKKRYDFFLDVRYTMDAIAPRLNPDCIKILHADTAYIPFHNAAEMERLRRIQERRGTILTPRRQEKPTPATEFADLITVLGNRFTIGTYRHTNKPIHRLQLSVPELYPWQDDKDFAACRHRFLWFGSWGLVHKGLDLVLEAFAEMPEYHLTVCGPIHKESDFEQAYDRELYETPNIHTVGWVNISSPEFLEIARYSVGLVYPSCSEGGGGCVLTCMHAGIIPIVTYEASVDIEEDYGVILKDCSIAEIKSAVQRIANKPSADLEFMARNAWEFARANHTRDRFAASYRQFTQQLVSTYSQKRPNRDYSPRSQTTNYPVQGISETNASSNHR